MYFVIWGVGMGIVTYLEATLFIQTGAKLACHIRSRFFFRLLLQESAYFDEHRTGDLTSRLTADSTLVQSSAAHGATFFQQIGLAVTAITMAFFFSWRMSLVLLGCMPVLLGLGVCVSVLVERLTKAGQDKYAAAAAIAEEGMTGVRTLQSFTAERAMSAQFDAVLQDAVRIEAKKVRLPTCYAPTLHVGCSAM